MECQTKSCNSRNLRLITKDRDVPRVTLIKGSKLYEKVHLLTGECQLCHTKYFPDHETSVQDAQGQGVKLYLNNAKYLKVGQSVWVDRVFSGGVVNGMYHFHASASAFAEFWNDTFWSTQKVQARKLSRRQIWHAFIQESLRTVAWSSKICLEMENGLPIEDVTKQAFIQLGENGVIRSAENHFCSECTHEYKATSDRITGDDPAAVLGIDENHQVPVLVGEDAELAVQVAARARFEADNAMDIDRSPSPDYEASPVKMVVMDGVVMGPTHCAHNDCTEALQNARGGVFCGFHEIVHENKCRMRDCDNPKVPPSQTCELHHNHWYSHVIRFGRQTLLGVRRLVRRSEQEHLPWLPQINHQVQPHDAAPVPQTVKDNYFVAPRFYCVETICAPCGAVIAWTLFDKSESPTKILNFLEAVYPTPDLRPNYVCIDKACAVLRTAISNGAWNTWKETTRFIVDSYHYINHRTSDYLCRKWCNPAPLNGSAPNLVIVENDVNGNPHYKRALNTQV
jgi:CxC5 like cysteine cluster associated with KDZ transposases/CxC6 like cysteine cluster associated with KDZ transposases